MMELNQNEKIVESVKARLKLTNGQCPCVPEDIWNEDTICPCKEMRESETCHCRLYTKL